MKAINIAVIKADAFIPTPCRIDTKHPWATTIPTPTAIKEGRPSVFLNFPIPFVSFIRQIL